MNPRNGVRLQPGQPGWKFVYKWGATCGIALLLIDIAFIVIVTVLHLGLGAFFPGLAASLAVFFLAGARAREATGSAGSGTIAGLVAGGVCTAVETLAVVGGITYLVVTGAQAGGAGGSPLIALLVGILLVVSCLFRAGAGAGFGTLGAMFGYRLPDWMMPRWRTRRPALSVATGYTASHTAAAARYAPRTPSAAYPSVDLGTASHERSSAAQRPTPAPFEPYEGRDAVAFLPAVRPGEAGTPPQANAPVQGRVGVPWTEPAPEQPAPPHPSAPHSPHAPWDEGSRR